MKTIPLTQGKVALVDDADYDAVSKFKWRVQKIGRRIYAVRGIRRPDGTWTMQYLHRFLMPGVAKVDHINGDGLNNSREENIRPATNKQNLRGFCQKRLGTTSKFRGVHWKEDCGKWRAQVYVDGKNIHLGLFVIEEDAARARDEAARKYLGERAFLNFP